MSRTTRSKQHGWLATIAWSFALTAVPVTGNQVEFVIEAHRPGDNIQRNV